MGDDGFVSVAFVQSLAAVFICSCFRFKHRRYIIYSSCLGIVDIIVIIVIRHHCYQTSLKIAAIFIFQFIYYAAGFLMWLRPPFPMGFLLPPSRCGFGLSLELRTSSDGESQLSKTNMRFNVVPAVAAVWGRYGRRRCGVGFCISTRYFERKRFGVLQRGKNLVTAFHLCCGTVSRQCGLFL